MDRSLFSDATKDSFVLVCGSGEKSYDLWAATILLVFKICGRRSNKIQKYGILQYMNATF